MPSVALSLTAFLPWCCCLVRKSFTAEICQPSLIIWVARTDSRLTRGAAFQECHQVLFSYAPRVASAEAPQPALQQPFVDAAPRHLQLFGNFLRCIENGNGHAATV